MQDGVFSQSHTVVPVAPSGISVECNANTLSEGRRSTPSCPHHPYILDGIRQRLRVLRALPAAPIYRPHAHHALLVKMPPPSLKPPTLLIQLFFLAALSNGWRRDAPRPCKVIPGDADWPSQGTWARLNESLGGGLLQPAPAGAVCHPGRRAYDADRCAAVAAAWKTHEFHADDPVSVQWNQFADDSCLPDGRYPCDGGGYPAFVVNASGVADVRHGVDFGESGVWIEMGWS